jgi:metal-responsive CopG/Arc/MetJ family transcriptional regulator
VPSAVWARSAPLSVKVRSEIVAQIDRAAIEMKVSRSEFIRNAIEAAIAKQHLQIEAAPLPVVLTEALR